MARKDSLTDCMSKDEETIHSEFKDRSIGTGPLLISVSIWFVAIPFVIFGVEWSNIAFHSKVEVVATMVVYFSFGAVAVVAFFISLLLNALTVKTQQTYFQKISNFWKEMKKTHFLKTNAGMVIQFVLFILFACGYTFNTFTYAEHLHTDQVDQRLLSSYSVVCIAFIWIQVIVLIFLQYYDKKISNGAKVLRMIIIVTNACSWMNAYLFESSEIFENKYESTSNATLYNSTNEQCFESIHEIAEIIFAPVTIEYTMMAIGFLFPTALEDVKYQRSWKMTCLIIVCLIIYEASVFGFSMYVVLQCTKIDETKGIPIEFLFYVILIAILFTAMIALLIVCVILKSRSKLRKSKDHHLHMSSFILLVTAFGNNLYHLLNSIAVLELDSISVAYKSIAFGQNILGLILAFLQTWFLLAIHRYDVTNETKRGPNSDSGCTCHAKTSLKHSCLALAVMNFGLWTYGSIAEIREPIFSYLQQKYYTGPSWNVILKIIFPLTIFYRFHSSMDFLNLWLHFAKED
ncbi:uncharacterized protein LOC133195000 [Saccostrea echinata]|uniref:uncharacterized protein LOC133195000 n=1 Tax=Saccostrea echinata TaxID=191078 RepID=UPI002A833821|nr:uncharacterized protein LOC133195000 [Saccostrea echinata]